MSDSDPRHGDPARPRPIQPGCSIEVLVPDFKGSFEALKVVMDARPEILSHNVETVPRLFKKVQPQDQYVCAQATLSNAKRMDAEVLTNHAERRVRALSAVHRSMYGKRTMDDRP